MDGNKDNGITVFEKKAPAYTIVHRANQFLEKLKKEQTTVNETARITEKAIAISDEYLNFFPPCNTLAPSIRLATFNFMKTYPGADVMKMLGGKNELVWKELNASRDKAYPSIGLEIEISDNLLPIDSPEFSHIQDAFTTMDIPVTAEPPYGIPIEFHFKPTHTADAQMELIKNLGEFLPEQEDISTLHVNIGVPKLPSKVDGYEMDEAVQEEYLEEQALPISDVMTLAFVPSKRISGRALQPSLQVKQAKSIKDNDDALRIEFRTPKLLDSTDDLSEMITSYQMLGCLLDPSNTIFGEQRVFFTNDVKKLLQKYQLESDFPFYDKDRAAQLVKQAEGVKKEFNGSKAPENIIDEARFLVRTYVERVNAILHPQDLSVAAD